jgi:hypothetical protein
MEHGLPAGVTPVSNADEAIARTEISVTLTNVSLGFDDAAPLLNQLAQRAGRVTVSRNNPRYPLMGGGFIDVAINIVIVTGGIGVAVGAIEFARTLGRLFAEDAHELIASLLRLRRQEVEVRGGASTPESPHTAISIQQGPFNIFVSGDAPDEEIIRRIELAILMFQDGVAPEEAPHGWLWNEATGRWEPVAE